MGTFQNTVTIARPADKVFAFLADLRNIPQWNYAITRTVQTSPGPAGVGATYRQTRTIPRRSQESLQITIFEPPSRLTVQGQIGPFQATTSYLLEPAAGATRLTNDVELETSSALLRLISPLAVPRIKAAVARNLGTLKGLLESEPPAAQRQPVTFVVVPSRTHTRTPHPDRSARHSNADPLRS
jgi:Polyketide cyclase / dehydrase and lipid transport